MKALTVGQPWAWAILDGRKRVENRTWRTAYRGPLLIHAGKSRKWLVDRLPDGSRPPAALIFGALVGVVELVDCVPVEARPGDPWASGPWCWIVASPRPLPRPIAYVGRQGLFAVPADLQLITREEARVG